MLHTEIQKMSFHTQQPSRQLNMRLNILGECNSSSVYCHCKTKQKIKLAQQVCLRRICIVFLNIYSHFEVLKLSFQKVYSYVQDILFYLSIYVSVYQAVVN